MQRNRRSVGHVPFVHHGVTNTSGYYGTWDGIAAQHDRPTQIECFLLVRRPWPPNFSRHMFTYGLITPLNAGATCTLSHNDAPFEVPFHNAPASVSAGIIGGSRSSCVTRPLLVVVVTPGLHFIGYHCPEPFPDWNPLTIDCRTAPPPTPT
ncbi:unnamed protein product [Sphacelaria rigidula]